MISYRVRWHSGDGCHVFKSLARAVDALRHHPYKSADLETLVLGCVIRRRYCRQKA